MILMSELLNTTMPLFRERKNQFALGAFLFFLISLTLGLQNGLIFTILWLTTGILAFLCIYFGFPNMWAYGVLIYVIYLFSAFGTILLIFWRDYTLLEDFSLAIAGGIILLILAFYVSVHIIGQIKKIRDITIKEKYVPLGFWSVGVISFPFLPMISMWLWSLWAEGNEAWLVIYIVIEIIIAMVLVYLLWIPDRNLNWNIEYLPKSRATRMIEEKSKVFVRKPKALTKKVMKPRKMCPECGLKLKIEMKTCPSCNTKQSFGWCIKSEAYAIPCLNCGTLNLFGKDKCSKCEEPLVDEVTCKSCKKNIKLRDWK
jgi:hypothetical protein